MKKTSIFTFGLFIIALIGGFLVWNFNANTASAQKNESTEGVNSGGATEYNARNEFALTQGGTSGVWNYGYTANASSDVFVPFPNTNTYAPCSSTPGSGTAFQEWRNDALAALPQLGANASGAQFSCGSLRVPTDAIYMHPGFNNERSVVRFTAPSTGTYQVAGVFEGLDNPGSRDVKIIKNSTGTALFDKIVNGQQHEPFNFSESLNAGDTLDFHVGSNGSYNFDATGLSVTVGQPPTACLTAPANLQVNVPAENSPSDVQSVNTNASLVGDATYTNIGKVGRAFDFDGNGDYVRIEDNPTQRPANAVTLEGWFKFDSTGGLISLISKPIRNSSLNSHTLYLEGGQLRGLIGNNSGQFTRALSSFVPQTGVWHHLAFTYNFSGGVSTLKLYANGVEVTSSVDGTANLPLFYDANPFPLLIGGEFENNAPGFFLDGQADEVSVYGRALAQTEIFDIVQQGSFGKCSPGSACLSAPSGLVSFYKGEDNALDSNSLNPGALQNGATFSSGQVGRSFSFDGTDDFVAVPDSNSLKVTGDLTIEAWIQPTQNPSFTHIVSKRSLDNANAEYDLLRQADGKLRFSSKNGGADNFVISNGTAPLNAYNHVAVTIQGGTLRFYINGVLDSAQGYSVVRPATGGRLTIGAAEATACGGSGVCEFFAGQIDELSIYNRAVSASEISSIFNAAGNGKCLTYVCAQPPNNLVSWFAGEQNALDSKSNNHGFLQNGATFQTAKVGQGFKFDGVNDYVEIPDNESLRPATLTLETWVKFDSLTSTVTGGAPAGYQNIIFKKNSRVAGSGFEGGYSLVKNPSNIIGIGFNSSGGAENFANSTTAVQAGVWYHIVGTHDGTNIRLYINGQLEGTGTATFPIDHGTTPLYLGNSQVPFSGYFNGVLDETSIYNRALTATEIQSIYNANSSGKCKPTGLNPAANQIAWFTGDGDTRDFTGLNSNGTLQGNTNYKIGKVGQSFNFDGNGDYITTADSPNWDFGTGDFAIEAWFNAPNPTGVQRIISAGSQADGANNLWTLGYGDICAWGCGQRLNFAIFNGGGYSDFSSNQVFFRPNTWHHAAVVRSGSTLTFFLDGDAVGTVAIGAGFVVNGGSTGAIIGARYNNNPSLIFEYANGRLDEVSIYNRALTTSEIAAVYQAGTAGKLKSAATPLNLVRSAKTSASFAPTTVQLSSATVTFAQVTIAGTTSQSNLDLANFPKLPSSATFTGLAYDISTTAVYQNGSADDVQVCFNLPSLTAIPIANLRVLHLENGVWVDRTASGNTYSNFCTDNLTSLSPFVIVEGLAPTAANVSVSGKITDSLGNGLGGVFVTLINSQGNIVNVRTNNFGRYIFNEVAVGDIYVVSVSSKSYSFAVSSQAISVEEAVENVNFTATEVSQRGAKQTP